VSRWKSVAVSVAGFDHIERGVPCQDCTNIKELSGGWNLAILSDGAGSALHAEEGSKYVCTYLIEYLATYLNNINQFEVSTFENIQAAIVSSIIALRDFLEASHPEIPLIDFSATIVGMISCSLGGIFFHIGDGAAWASNSDNYGDSIMSRPRNGDYSNESFFFTEVDWRQNLIFTNFDSDKDILVLMSDGVTPYGLNEFQNDVSHEFIKPIHRFLADNTELDCESALIDLLNLDKVRRITGDDKSLVMAIRSNA
jgi:Protein phosphatase 2C